MHKPPRLASYIVFLVLASLTMWFQGVCIYICTCACFCTLQVTSWFLRMSLATLFEIAKFSENFKYQKCLSDVLSHLCVHEQIEISLPARLLYSMSSMAMEQSKLLELTELETKFLVQSLKLYTLPIEKWSRLKWVNGEPCVSINLKLDFLFLMKLFEMNSRNCLQFIEANPLEILIEMVLVDVYHDKTVQLIYCCIVSSGQNKAKVIEYFDPILQITNMKETFRGESSNCLTE